MVCAGVNYFCVAYLYSGHKSGTLIVYMSTSDKQSEQTKPPTSQTVILLTTMADTTWRMFVPTIGLTVLGLVGDRLAHTTPWLMVMGIVCGVVLSYVLIKRQLDGVKSEQS
jgi:F0F1-type ATP synthase assembly protein I